MEGKVLRFIHRFHKFTRLPSVFLGKLACIMLTMESTIMDIAMGTEATDLLKASV